MAVGFQIANRVRNGRDQRIAVGHRRRARDSVGDEPRRPLIVRNLDPEGRRDWSRSILPVKDQRVFHPGEDVAGSAEYRQDAAQLGVGKLRTAQLHLYLQGR